MRCGASSAGGQQGRYGLSWRLVPPVLHELLGDQDPARARRTMEAMLKMGKLDIAALKRAHQGAWCGPRRSRRQVRKWLLAQDAPRYG